MSINGYNLTRDWYDFKFENPSKVRANHSDFYLYLVDQWNRLGQKKEFGLPTSYTMECLGIGSYNTYKKILSDLVLFGFVKIVKDSNNQHNSKIIALSKFDKAPDKANDEPTNKALDKATIKALDKATDTIIKQYNNLTIEQINNILVYFNGLPKSEISKKINELKIIDIDNEKDIYRKFNHLKLSIDEFEKLIELGHSKIEIDEVLDNIENFKENKKYKSLYLTSKNWLKNEKKYKDGKSNNSNGSSKSGGIATFTAEDFIRFFPEKTKDGG